MTTTAANPTTTPTVAQPTLELVRKKLAKRSFATLGSVSPAGRPHAAGVLYAAHGDELYISTLRSSRKARNVAADPHVFVSVPVRRLPFGPPATIQYAATAEVLGTDDPHIVRLAEAGAIKAVTSHGELDLPDGCFLRIHPPRRYLTYGLGLSLRKLIADPLAAGAVVERDDAARPARSAR